MYTFDRLFNEIFETQQAQAAAQAQTPKAWHAGHEVEETEQAYLLSFDLPGVPKEKLDVQVKDRHLYITAERPDRHAKFERVLTLPTGVDAEKIEALYEQGVLRVALPRAEASKPKQVQVRDAKDGGFWAKRVAEKAA